MSVEMNVDDEDRASSELGCKALRSCSDNSLTTANALSTSSITQVVEAMVCMFEGGIDTKRVRVGSPGVDTIVPGVTQCRACSAAGDRERVTDLHGSLLNERCIAGSAACRCNDDESEYFFKNGAILHYKYSGGDDEKDLNSARKNLGMDPLSSYNAIFMNAGNANLNVTESALKAAVEVQEAETPFFWLSTYCGVGRMSLWDTHQTMSFSASGARYVDIECMMRGMEGWTKGVVEDRVDPHYCLPGPPNEIAVLLLKIMWAIYEEEKVL